MKTPIIKYNDKFLDRIGLFVRINGITIYPFIIMRKKYKQNKTLLNHESIHIKQQEELLVIPFYLLYALEWLVKSVVYRSFKKAYFNLSFEREAYDNERDLSYLDTRKKYTWLKKIFK
jgi:hypothetical protein